MPRRSTALTLPAEALRVTRLIRSIAAGMALLVVVLVPLGYFIVAYRYEVNRLSSEAEHQVEHISEVLVSGDAPSRTSLPVMTEALSTGSNRESGDQYRLIDDEGTVVAAVGATLGSPVLVQRALIFADGKPVAILEAETSLRPLLLHTVAAALPGVLLALAILTVVWTVPSRIVRHAFERLADNERELRAARDNAEAGNRAKSEFLATMSHELRTPLNAIIGFAELMNRRMFGALGHHQYEEYTRIIVESGTHLLSMVNDILDLTKADVGMLDVLDESVDLSGIIGQASKMVEPQAIAAGIDLQCCVSEGCPGLRGDARRLKQVVLNLLSNAMKFTERGGQVEVSLAGAVEVGLKLTVRDTGIGIAERDIPRALSVFQQVDSSLGRKYEGSGLGLPLAKRLIEAHGGTMTLESRVGEGTCVTAHFPADRLCAGSLEGVTEPISVATVAG
jgi:signal transduction histidine kinase